MTWKRSPRERLCGPDPGDAGHAVMTGNGELSLARTHGYFVVHVEDQGYWKWSFTTRDAEQARHHFEAALRHDGTFGPVTAGGDPATL